MRRLLLALLLALLLGGPTQASQDPPDEGAGPQPAIVGGVEAAPGEFPFMAAIFRRETSGELRQFCAGTIVNARWVLSAAHCYFDELGRQDVLAADLTVVVGRRRLSSDTGQALEVGEIVAHPEFDPARFDSDLALLRLAAAIDLEGEGEVAVVDLPDAEEEATLAPPGALAQATGWGDTNNSGVTSDLLLKVGLPIVSAVSCRNFWGVRTISDNMICAGDSADEDTCRGDSGGPLLVRPTSARGFVQVGITSFGTSSCGLGVPAVFTRVSRFSNWIGGVAMPQVRLPLLRSQIVRRVYLAPVARD
jgi:secreted trypsin-like serine protease